MSRTLIIAEKPSVAADLARVLGKELGKFTRDKSGAYYHNDSAIITSAVGHLLEQQKPMRGGKALPWKFDVLPVIPEPFVLEPIKSSEDRLKKILQLARQKDVTEIVNACDAGREGELIFYNLVRYGKWTKPTRRLWMQSMTDEAILSAWHNLRTEEEMRPLRDAAISRSEADWLVGINSTRALTAGRSKNGGFNKTPAGRVQTPTLAIMVKREHEIRAFVEEPYSEVWARFGIAAGEYDGKWIDPDWKKDDNNPQSRPERIWDPALPTVIRDRCLGKAGDITEEKKRDERIAPLLYDLTSLQREASSRFGFSAKRTLSLAQECYEKHKVLTYPRTDSRYLPEDYVGKAYGIVGAIAEGNPDFAPFAKDILDNKRIKPNKRVFDSKKVSDHFAIIPTGKIEKLSGDAQKLYEMVLARFLAVFFPKAIYEDTTRTTTITHSAVLKDVFLTKGRVLVEPGWMAVYGRRAGASKEDLAPARAGEDAAVREIEIRNAMTKPPARFNEATLLAYMEGAGKLVDDEKLAEAMKERGLGTPATRASIIEGLIGDDYIARDGRDLVPTRRGMELIGLLELIKVSTLADAGMTGDWEYRLKQMEAGHLDRAAFMRGITDLTDKVVALIKAFYGGEQPTLPGGEDFICPACGVKGLKHTLDYLSCPACKFRVKKIIAGRDMDLDELKILIQEGKTDILTGFTSKFGKPFEAGVELNEKHQATLYFRNEPKTESDGADEAAEPDVKVATVAIPGLGEFDVMETAKFWRVPGLVLGKEKQPMSISRTILSREVTLEQAIKILTEGKSDLLKGFISQRTKRPFDAFLVFNAKSGKIGFEFLPREKKSDDAPKKKSPAKSAKKKQ